MILPRTELTRNSLQGNINANLTLSELGKENWQQNRVIKTRRSNAVQEIIRDIGGLSNFSLRIVAITSA